MSADTNDLFDEIEQELQLESTTESKKKQESKEQIEKRAVLLSDIPGIYDYFPAGLNLSIPINAELDPVTLQSTMAGHMPSHFSMHTPLFAAINLLQSPALINLLLEYGVDPNGRCMGERLTPLMFIVTFMPNEIGNLLKKGADPLLRSNQFDHLGNPEIYGSFGNSVFDWAVSSIPLVRVNYSNRSELFTWLTKEYISFSNVKLDDVPEQLATAVQDTQIGHSKQRIQQLFPLMAAVADRFYKNLRTSPSLPVLKEFFSERGMQDFVSIIALYSFEMPLYEISDVLISDPKLYAEIKEQLSYFFNTAYRASKQNVIEDHQRMLTQFLNPSKKQKDQVPCEPVDTYSTQSFGKGDGKRSAEKEMTQDNTTCAGGAKEKAAETKAVVSAAPTKASSTLATAGYILSWAYRASIANCRRRCKSKATKSNTDSKIKKF